MWTFIGEKKVGLTYDANLSINTRTTPHLRGLRKNLQIFVFFSHVNGTNIFSLPSTPYFTDPFPLFTSTIQTPLFPPGPFRILKEKIAFIFFTYCAPSCLMKTVFSEFNDFKKH